MVSMECRKYVLIMCIFSKYFINVCITKHQAVLDTDTRMFTIIQHFSYDFIVDTLFECTFLKRLHTSPWGCAIIKTRFVTFSMKHALNTYFVQVATIFSYVKSHYKSRRQNNHRRSSHLLSILHLVPPHRNITFVKLYFQTLVVFARE